MISKLPRWVWTGAWILAFIAGMVNVVGLLGFEHQAITHLTGNTSLLAEALAKLDWPAALHFATHIGAFVAGTAISGFIIQDSALQLGRRYGVGLLLVSLLLFVSVPLFETRSAYGMYTAACACGLQNAMVSTYSGTVSERRICPACSRISGFFLAMRCVAIPSTCCGCASVFW